MAQSMVSRKRSVRRVPCPARQRPAAGSSSRRMRKSSRSTGKRISSTSGSVSRELVMWVWTPSAPSKPLPSFITPAGAPEQIVS